MAILNNVSFLFSCLAFVTGLYCIKALNRIYLTVFILASVSIFVEILSFVLGYYQIENLSLLFFFTIVEYLLWTVFFMLIFNNSVANVIIIVASILFLGSAILDYIFYEFKAMNNYSLSTECIILVGYSFFLFFKVMKNSLTDNLLREPYFWFNCGVLIYFSGNILLFLLGKFLNNEQTWFIWAPIHNILNIIYNSLIAIGFWKTRNR